MQLVIGDPAYSTWSLRPWLVLRKCGAEFEEVVVRLNRPDTADRIARHSPNGKVPALHVDGVTVWDSMAICVWAAERFPDAELWPADAPARWQARSVCCEMHSAFGALRTHLGMGPEHTMVGPDRSPTPTADGVEADIRRMVAIWREMRQAHGAGGDYMFGRWSIADAFFTPVAARFRHYQVDLAAYGDDGTAAAYRDILLNDPLFLEWSQKGLADLAAH